MPWRDRNEVPPPLVCRSIVALAAILVPHDYRDGWRARWSSRFRNLLALLDRGELAGSPAAYLAWLCRAAIIDAFWSRVHKPSLRNWSLGAPFVITCAAVLLAAIGLFSEGFSMTRWLATSGYKSIRPPRANPLFLYAFPVVVSLIAGGALVGLRRLAWKGYGWRYWTFFAVKTSMLAAVCWLLWVEGGAAVRARLHPEMLRILVGGLACSLALIVLFCRTLAWCVADQRVRCPVCLRRLAMPVSLGSRSSVLDPAKTELLCSAGHGSLCLSDSDEGLGDRWMALDASWQSFFEEAHSAR